MNQGQADSLFLCRTPLQARICLKLLEKEGIESFDVVYFTQNDSDSDRHYFCRMKENGCRAEYIHVQPRSPDILNHLAAILKLQKYKNFDGYRKIFLASLDCILFRYIIKQNSRATLHGFDDGTANITPTSLYFDDYRYVRARLYGAILGIPSSEKVKDLLVRHYSIYPGFDNVVPEDKIIHLSLFDGSRSTEGQLASGFTFFIGQPFQEAYSADALAKLKAWVSTQRVDYYVMHPRESTPLLDHIPVLEKSGQLAEDAIIHAAGGRRPRVLAAYSSVLFNMSSDVADKFYIASDSTDIEAQRIALARRAGCSVVNLE